MSQLPSQRLLRLSVSIFLPSPQVQNNLEITKVNVSSVKSPQSVEISTREYVWYNLKVFYLATFHY